MTITGGNRAPHMMNPPLEVCDGPGMRRDLEIALDALIGETLELLVPVDQLLLERGDPLGTIVEGVP